MSSRTQRQAFWDRPVKLAKRFLHAFVATCVLLLRTLPAKAHPHVFVDGGVDLKFNEEGLLEALQITWLYDRFETLYILSSHGLSLNAAGGLDEADRQHLIRLRSDWPDDFDGSAHLFVAETQIALKWPTSVDARLVDGRLQLMFTRPLETALDLRHMSAEIAFYESTYFFAFSITNTPQLLGDGPECMLQVRPFQPNAGDLVLQSALMKLGREETPGIDQVGALFADRVVVQCA